MPWPRGKPRTPEQKKAISNGVLYGRKPRNICPVCGRECPKIGATWCSVDCRYSDQDYLRRIKEERNTPEWRKKMSEQTTASWNDPDIRAAIIDGQRSHFETTDYGSNFPTGTPQSELDYESVLCPVGYVKGYVIPTNRPECNGGGYYKLDYAHVEAKVDIEIDGSSHKFKTDSDARRDAFLRSLGWRVIRIKV